LRADGHRSLVLRRLSFGHVLQILAAPVRSRATPWTRRARPRPTLTSLYLTPGRRCHAARFRRVRTDSCDRRTAVAGSDRAGPDRPRSRGRGRLFATPHRPPRALDRRVALPPQHRLCMGAARRGATGAWQAPPPRVPWGGIGRAIVSSHVPPAPQNQCGLVGGCAPNTPFQQQPRARCGVPQPTVGAFGGHHKGPCRLPRRRRGVLLFVFHCVLSHSHPFCFLLGPPPSLGHSHLASSSAQPPRRPPAAPWCRQPHTRPPRQRRGAAQRGAAAAGSVCRPRGAGAAGTPPPRAPTRGGATVDGRPIGEGDDP